METIHCTNCNIRLNPKFSFCPNCGYPTKIDSEKIPKTIRTVICPNCNKELDSKNNFCSSCGYALKTQDSDDVIPAFNCPNCNEKVDMGSKFCPYCGYLLVSYNKRKEIVQGSQTQEKTEKVIPKTMGLEVEKAIVTPKTMDSEVGKAIDAKIESILNGLGSIADFGKIITGNSDNDSKYSSYDEKNIEAVNEAIANATTAEEKLTAELEKKYIAAEEAYQENCYLPSEIDYAEIAERAKNQARAIMSTKAKADEDNEKHI